MIKRTNFQPQPQVSEEDEIRKMFENEVRDKKRTASGVHSKTGLRGYVGRINMPTDFMSRKEKREYTKPSKVRIEYMDISIMPLQNFYALPHEDAKQTLKRYRKRYSVKKIREEWSTDGKIMSSGTFYKLLETLGIDTDKKTYGKRGPYDRTKKADNMSAKTEQQNVAAPPAPPAPAFGIEMHGEFQAEDIVSRLMKFAAFLEHEPGKFKIDLSILEEK